MAVFSHQNGQVTLWMTFLTATLASIKADPIKMAPEKTGWDIKRCQNRVTQGWK